MLYSLGYYELLFFSLIGIAVCGCNQNMHRYVCMAIGGDVVLIFGANFGLLLLVVAFYCTVEGGSLHLHCKFLLN